MRQDILEFFPTIPEESRSEHIVRVAQLLATTSPTYNEYKIRAAINGSDMSFEPMLNGSFLSTKQILQGERQPPAKYALDFRKLFLMRLKRATNEAHPQGIVDKAKK